MPLRFAIVTSLIVVGVSADLYAATSVAYVGLLGTAAATRARDLVAEPL